MQVIQFWGLWYGMVWYVWCGMDGVIWYDVVYYVMVWYGTVHSEYIILICPLMQGLRIKILDKHFTL